MKIDWEKVKVEASGYLSELIRIDTSNPPGNEMEAIHYLKNIAEENGLYTKIQETAENRGNIIISPKPAYHQPIVLLSHVDVVPAQEEDWEVPPFSGKIINEELWGRGTIDAKQLTITHLMTLILLKRNNINLSKSVIMIATSDEENGSKYGLISFLEKDSTVFENAIVFNEGGGFPVVINDNKYYLVEMGQKGRAHIRLTFPGEQALNPYMPNNSAVDDSVQAIERLKNHSIEEPIPAVTTAMFQIISRDLGIEHLNSSDTTLDTFFAHIPDHLKNMFQSMTKTTFALTKWRGGRKHNGDTVIDIDCRPLPHVNENTLQKYIKDILQGIDVEAEIVSFSQGFETEINESMLKVFEEELQREVKDAKIVPFMTIGANDARLLLPYHSQVYGYCPMLPDMTFDKVIKMVHGVNEKIPIESLRFGIENMYLILERIGRSEAI